VKTLHPDILLLGGGVAGLWTLARLRAAGFQALLAEPRGLGGVQTAASQGIVHGGTKYALGGRLTPSAQAIAAMPGRWRACLGGSGELDLRAVRRLADHQYLWATADLRSRLTGFFASHAMRARVTAVAPGEGPAALERPGFTGRLWRLDEPVLDVGGLSATLAALGAGACLHFQDLDLLPGQPPGVRLHHPGAGTLELRPRYLVLTAGAGNAALLRALGREAPRMQLRPLHMTLARGPLPPLYLHCLGAGTSPRLTVTSHPLADGRWVWYLGGDLSESGVGRDREAQIAAAREELAALFPWVEGEGLSWATWRVERAEVATPGGRRPEEPYVHNEDGLSVVWPTKLAFAPLVAERILDALGAAGLRPGPVLESPAWPAPPLAPHPWQESIPWT